MAANMTPERLALAKQCLEDGWSQIEIYRTHRIHPTTLRKHFPGCGWTMKQGSEMGSKVRKANRKSSALGVDIGMS